MWGNRWCFSYDGRLYNCDHIYKNLFRDLSFFWFLIIYILFINFFFFLLAALHGTGVEKEMATHSSVLAWRIPGMGSLVGCRLWGRTESDTTEAT